MSGSDVPAELRADLNRRLADELGHRVQGWSRVAGGAQNRLFRLDTLDGPPFLAKLYAQDRWPRLEREYTVLLALQAHGLARVPRPLLRDDRLGCAVYSFEPGETCAATELSRRDVEEVAAFTADLHRFGPEDLPAELLPASDASFAPAEQLRVIHGRLADMGSFAAAPPKHNVALRHGVSKAFPSPVRPVPWAFGHRQRAAQGALAGLVGRFLRRRLGGKSRGTNRVAGVGDERPDAAG